jgi:iron complex transport system substrate-binding protein
MKMRSLIGAAILIAIAAAACGPSSSEEAGFSPIEIIDGLGRTVRLERHAERIVSLAPSNTEILFAIGAGDQVVGRDEFSDYPEAALTVPSIGGSFGEIIYEALIELQPDLVFAGEITPAEQVREMEELGLTVFWLTNPVTIQGMFTNLETTSLLAGHADKTRELIGDLTARLETVQQALAEVETRPLVFYEIDGSDPLAPWTSGKGTFIDTLIQLAKGKNIGRVLDGDYAQISIEELLVQDPDVILLGDAAWGVTAESVAARAGWETLQAVETQLIFPFDDNLASRPGPRLIEGLETLARLLHPEAFE